MAVSTAEEKMVDAQGKKQPKVAKKAKTPAAKKPEHPRYLDMIMEAIKTLKEKNGSSRVAIEKYIANQYHADSKVHLKAAYKRGVETGSLKQHKMSFQINKASSPESKAKSSKGAAKASSAASQNSEKPTTHKSSKKTTKASSKIEKKASHKASQKAPSPKQSKTATATKKDATKPALKKDTTTKPASKKRLPKRTSIDVPW